MRSGDKNLTNVKRMMEDETLDIAPIEFETLNFTCEVIRRGGSLCEGVVCAVMCLLVGLCFFEGKMALGRKGG